MARKADTNKDQLLLNILKQNARIPLSEIAKELGVTRATVQARLTRLEQEGYIGGYTIVSGVDSGTVEMLSAIILVELEVKTQSRVIAELKKIPEVASCHTLSGQYDLFIKIRCRLSSELDELIDRVAGLEGVRRTTSSIMLSRKFER
jgi:DNA-binding Lrp family transcriptional regulator